MKIEKCSFFDSRMELLGFVVTSRGVGPMQGKLNTIKDMVVSHDKKTIKSFLGLVRYYTRFVTNLAELAVPLQNLLKKTSDAEKEWGDEHDTAVKEIKEAFVSLSLLKALRPLPKDYSADRCKRLLCHGRRSITG